MIRRIDFVLDSGETYNSWDDFALIRTSKTIGKAEVKKTIIDIPGADGVIDLSEYFGEPKYKNRKLTFEFSYIETEDSWNSVYSDIQNKLNGQDMKVILEEDSDYYYAGRCSVNDWKSNKKTGNITIEIDADPYKYKINPTVIENVVTESAVLNFENLRKSVVPTIKTTGSINIIFENKQYALSAGTYIMPDMVFKAGTNTMTVTGNAAITVTYQEGGL